VNDGEVIGRSWILSGGRITAWIYNSESAASTKTGNAAGVASVNAHERGVPGALSGARLEVRGGPADSC